MKFLADMNISLRTVSWLRQHGYEIVHLREENLQRAADEFILAKAHAEQRILLTMDLDFGYLLAVSGGCSPSVILFRLSNNSYEIVNEQLAKVLNRCQEDLQMGSIISVSDDAIRIRRLPILSQ